jgi:hypothetical protein
MSATIKKRCEKCGATNAVAPRVRRCHQVTAWGLCWGRLKTTKRKRYKLTLERELEIAHEQLAEALTRMKRAVTSVDGWQGRIKAIGRRIAERDHPKEKKPKAIKRTRVIVLPEAHE